MSAQTEKTFLENYNPNDYTRLSVATDIVAFSVFSEAENNYRKLPDQKLNLLLIKRGEHPFKGEWALPGGFVRPDETTDQTARRELEEETGVSGIYMEQLYTFSEVNRDPRMRVMSVAYMALMPESGKLHAATDAEAASWFEARYECINQGVVCDTYRLSLCHDKIKLEALIHCHKIVVNGRMEQHYEIDECQGIAFDHAKIIALAIERLRGKVDYTDVAFELVPELFTLTQLQKVYEIILDKTLTPANFRRKLTGRVVETEAVAEGGGYRNAKLFRRNL